MANSNWFDESFYLSAKAAYNNAHAVGGLTTWTSASVQASLNAAGMTAQQHYSLYGWTEGLAPNAYYVESQYVTSKVAALNAGAVGGKTDWTAADFYASLNGNNPFNHYLQYGAYETGVEPSTGFNDDTYYADKAAYNNANAVGGITTWTADTVKAAFQANGLTPIGHYELYGATENFYTPTPTPAPGDTYTLTLGVDTATAQTFIAPLIFNAPTGTQLASLQTGDTLTGTAGTTDTLTASLNGTALNPTITGVENINLSVYANTALTASNISGTGVTINSDVVGGTTLTTTGLGASIALGKTGTGTLSAAKATNTSADVFNLTVSGGNAGTFTDGGTAETINVNSAGSAANTITMTTFDSGTSATKSTITGTQSLTLKDGSAAAASTIFGGDFIDASGLGTGAKLTIDTARDMTGTGATTVALGNMTNLDTVKFAQQTGAAAALTVTGLKSGNTAVFSTAAAGKQVAQNLVLDNAALTGATDTLNLQFLDSTGVVGTGVGGTTSALGFETLNVLAKSTAATPGTLTFTGTTTLAVGQIGKTSTINIDTTGNQAVTFTGAVTADAINAAGYGKALTVTTTGSQMAITGGNASDSITVGNFSNVISTGGSNDAINVAGSTTATNTNTINGGDGVDAITLGAAGTSKDTLVFGGSSTWGDTVSSFELYDAVASNVEDTLNFSKSNGFSALKHGTTNDAVTFATGTSTVGANDTVLVNNTVTAGTTTAAALQAANYTFTGETAGGHIVYVAVNSNTSFSVFDVVSNNNDGFITTADQVTLVGSFSGVVAAGAGNASVAGNWNTGMFTVA